MADDAAPVGGFAGKLRDAIVGAHGALSDTLDERKRAHVETLLETLESDLRPYIGPIIAEALLNPGIPEHMRPLLQQAGDPDHQFASLAVGVAIGAVMGPILQAVIAPVLDDIADEAWMAHPVRDISADVATAAVLKGVLTEGQGAAYAKREGYDATNFDLLVQSAGQSIGLAQALLLLRRDQITLDHFRRIIQYSNINPLFYDDVEKLRYGPPTTGEVITGALKGHRTDEEARIGLAHAGMDPANYEWLKATAGRPISTLEALHLWNREKITEARVDEIVRQSDINQEFLPEVKMLREYFPPPRSVVPMLRSGSITEAQARTLLGYYGVNDEWTEAFVREAQHTSTAAAKGLTQAQIVSSYEARLMDRPEAHARLVAIHYSPADADALLDLGDERRAVALQNAAARMIGSKYVAYRLTKQEAADLLTGAKIPTAAQVDMFDLWTLEREANLKDPTPAMIMHVYRQGNMGPADARRRLIAIGIPPDDLGVWIMNAYPPGKGEDAAQAALEIEFS